MCLLQILQERKKVVDTKLNIFFISGNIMPPHHNPSLSCFFFYYFFSKISVNFASRIENASLTISPKVCDKSWRRRRRKKSLKFGHGEREFQNPLDPKWSKMFQGIQLLKLLSLISPNTYIMKIFLSGFDAK